jgi:hypothetical protein
MTLEELNEQIRVKASRSLPFSDIVVGEVRHLIEKSFGINLCSPHWFTREVHDTIEKIVECVRSKEVLKRSEVISKQVTAKLLDLN